MHEAECFSNVWKKVRMRLGWIKKTIQYRTKQNKAKQKEDSDRHTQRERVERRDGLKSKGEGGRRRHILIYYNIEF